MYIYIYVYNYLYHSYKPIQLSGPRGPGQASVDDKEQLAMPVSSETRRSRSNANGSENAGWLVRPTTIGICIYIYISYTGKSGMLWKAT